MGLINCFNILFGGLKNRSLYRGVSDFVVFKVEKFLVQ